MQVRQDTPELYNTSDAHIVGWLGWPANLGPAAQLFTQVWTNAGKSPFIRGLATSKFPSIILMAISRLFSQMLPTTTRWSLPHRTQLLKETRTTTSCFTSLFVVQQITALVLANHTLHRTLHLNCRHKAGLLPSSLTRVVLVFRTSANNGVTGATSKALGLVLVRPPTLRRLSSTPLSGSSPEENATAPQTPLLRGTITTVDW